jgi:hypothetical protein
VRHFGQRLTDVLEALLGRAEHLMRAVSVCAPEHRDWHRRSAEDLAESK